MQTSRTSRGLARPATASVPSNYAACAGLTGRNAIYDALRSRGSYAAKNLNSCKWNKRKAKRLTEDLDTSKQCCSDNGTRPSSTWSPVQRISFLDDQSRPELLSQNLTPTPVFKPWILTVPWMLPQVSSKTRNLI